MLLALGIAIVSIGLGAALGLFVSGTRAFGPVRVAALLLGGAVALADLLPQAVHVLGLTAVAIFLLALLGPLALGRLVRRLGHEGSAIGVELGYAGLLVHKLGDGIGLETFARPGAARADVLIAIALHTIPVVAVFVQALAAHRGRRQAAVRAVGLAVAAVVGVIAAGVVPSGIATTAEPFVGAAVAGLLLHVVAHGWLPWQRADEHAPKTE